MNLNFTVLTKLLEHTAEVKIVLQAADVAKRIVYVTVLYDTDNYRNVITII